MIRSLIRGVIIGLITGMPVGPIGAFCLKITLSNGTEYGLAAGLGSSIADSLYAVIAVLGLKVISRFLIRYHIYFRFFGGLILIVFGIHTFLAKHKNKEIKANSKTLLKSFISTFALALANPATVFSFMAVFAGTGLSHAGRSPVDKIFLIIGVFIGSQLWWLFLILTAGKFHNKLDFKKMKAVNKILGSMITAFGLFIFLSASSYAYVIKPPFLHSKLFELFLGLKGRFPYHRFR